MNETTRPIGPPPGLPSWPQWTLAPGGHGLTISGAHLTPFGARLAWFVSTWVTVAGLAFPGWYYWGFKTTPDWLRVTLNAASAQFGHALTFPERKWAYVGVWVCCWMLFRIWRRIFVALLAPAFRRRSTVQFTARHVILPRAFRRSIVLDRRAVDPLTFILQPDPDLPWRELRAQRKGTPDLATFYRQVRHLFLQYGINLVPVTRFASPLDADRFDHVCLYALRYPLQDVPPAGQSATGTITDV